jgi:hypothetical protein
MTSEWWNDDDALLASVKAALREADDVPISFIESGKASYTWHSIDAELAALSYDSAHDDLVGATTRAEQAELRSLTFDARGLSIELEIIAGTLHGQLVPPQAGTVELRQEFGTVTPAEVNDAGYFTISPVPEGAFRLYCRTEGGATVLTDQITL